MEGLYNPYFVIPLTTWFAAQIAKFVQKAWRGEINFRLLYNSGGMPSAHSAVVSSLAITTLVINGPRSPLFGIAVVIAAIVMYDSFGVRRASGDQAVAINAIIDSLEGQRGSSDVSVLRLREMFGHKPSEVIVGAIVGTVISLAMTTSLWIGEVRFLGQPAMGAETYLYLAIFLILIAASLLVHWLTSRKPYRNLPLAGHFRKVIWWLAQLPAWGGLLFIVLQKESVQVWRWRLWPLLILAILLITHSLLAFYWYRYLPSRLQEQAAILKKRRQRTKRSRRKKR